MPNTKNVGSRSLPRDSMISEASYCWFAASEVTDTPIEIAATSAAVECRVGFMESPSSRESDPPSFLRPA
jgi:hypothetical protein